MGVGGGGVPRRARKPVKNSFQNWMGLSRPGLSASGQHHHPHSKMMMAEEGRRGGEARAAHSEREFELLVLPACFFRDLEARMNG